MRRFGLSSAYTILFPPPPPPRSEARLPDGRWPTRYETLDHLRGIAAIGIVLHHAADISFGLGTTRVLMFFVISGYCIAASAESCRRRGMTPRTFLTRRFHRIYPPYFLALLFYLGTRVVKLLAGGGNDLDRHWLDYLQNFTLTQWVTITLHPATSPGANPVLFVAAFWSLCYEEQFYLIIALFFALSVAFKRLRMWAMILGVVPLTLVWGIINPVYVRGLFYEYWVSFALGALAYYRLSVIKSRNWLWLIDVTVVVLAAASLLGMEFDPRVPSDLDRSKWLEWLSASVFYIVLVLLRPVDARISRLPLLAPLRAVGRITYSLYLIHQFNLHMVDLTATRLIRVVHPAYASAQDGFDRPWYHVVVQVVLHVALAFLFWLFCELPFLNKPITGERAEAATPPPPTTSGVPPQPVSMGIAEQSVQPPTM